MFRPVLLFKGVEQKYFYKVKAAANETLNKTSVMFKEKVI